MNIGPTADGLIMPIFQDRLRGMGDWLHVNGESIYGTRKWRIPQETDEKGNKLPVWYGHLYVCGLLMVVHVMRFGFHKRDSIYNVCQQTSLSLYRVTSP